MRRQYFFGLFLPLLVGTLGAQSLPAGDGRDIVQEKCGGCHALKVVTSKRASRAEWSRLVDQMISRGAEVEDEDIQTVVDYLTKNFGPGAPLPDASGKKPVSVNVNSASSDCLSKNLDLPVSESEAIVTYRQQHGKFKDWHELAKVPGIDADKIEKNKDRLTF